MNDADRYAPHCGYHHSTLPAEDAELCRVGPGAPGGELMRRFRQPVAPASELGELPKRIRILGEKLVLFRDGSGRTGLLRKALPAPRCVLRVRDEILFHRRIPPASPMPHERTLNRGR